MQVPWGVILFCGLATFMPDSPRQLLRIGKVDDARREFLKIRKDLNSQAAGQEFALMRAQIEYEVEREVKSYKEIFRLFRHRALVWVLCGMACKSDADSGMQVHCCADNDQLDGRKRHTGMLWLLLWFVIRLTRSSIIKVRYSASY